MCVYFVYQLFMSTATINTTQDHILSGILWTFVCVFFFLIWSDTNVHKKMEIYIIYWKLSFFQLFFLFLVATYYNKDDGIFFTSLNPKQTLLKITIFSQNVRRHFNGCFYFKFYHRCINYEAYGYKENSVSDSLRKKLPSPTWAETLTYNR